MKHQTIDRRLSDLLVAKLTKLRTESGNKDYWNGLSQREAFIKIALFAVGEAGY